MADEKSRENENVNKLKQNLNKLKTVGLGLEEQVTKVTTITDIVPTITSNIQETYSRVTDELSKESANRRILAQSFAEISKI